MFTVRGRMLCQKSSLLSLFKSCSVSNKSLLLMTFSMSLNLQHLAIIIADMAADAGC